MKTPRGIVAATMAATLLLSACARPPQQEQILPLAIETADGHTLAATFWPVEAPSPPGVVLVHMHGADRGTWRVLAQRLQRAGIAALAFDLRGHGDSQAVPGGPQSFRTFSHADWAAAVNDIDAAVQALMEQGADPERLAAAGAGIGANLALNHAAASPHIAALALLSPGREYRGIGVQPALDNYMPRPLLLLASEGDAYSAQTCTEMARGAHESLVEIRLFPGMAHGTDILDASDAAAGRFLEWLQMVLLPQH